MVDGIVLHLLESRLWYDGWVHGVVADGDHVSWDLTEAVWTVDVSILVAVVGGVTGNGAERLAITVEHLGTEGTLRRDKFQQ